MIRIGGVFPISGVVASYLVIECLFLDGTTIPHPIIIGTKSIVRYSYLSIQTTAI